MEVITDFLVVVIYRFLRVGDVKRRVEVNMNGVSYTNLWFDIGLDTHDGFPDVIAGTFLIEIHETTIAEYLYHTLSWEIKITLFILSGEPGNEHILIKQTSFILASTLIGQSQFALLIC